MKKEKYTPPKVNKLKNIQKDSVSVLSDIYTDSYAEGDFTNKECSPYNFPFSEIKHKNNLIYIPIVKETELTACAISLSTKNTIILSKFESAVLTGKRMITEVVKSDSGITYLLIWIPRIHVFFYSDLTEPISNNILFPLFLKKQILKITYSPYWIYSLIYQYTKKRTYGIESIQFMHCLTEYTTLECKLKFHKRLYPSQPP